MAELVEPEPVNHQQVQLRDVPVAAHPLVVRFTDVVQGNIAGCPIVAAMAAMAHARLGAIQQVLGAPNADDVFSKRSSEQIFTHWSTAHYSIRFRHGQPVKISPVLYHNDGQVSYASTPNGSGWPSFIEKAYAVWRGRNSYNELDERFARHPVPDGGMVMDDLAGPPDMYHLAGGRFFPHGGADRPLTAALLAAGLRRATSRPTIAGSLEQGAGHGIEDNHAYAVLRYGNGRVDLYNPWGGPGAQVQIPLADFRAAFQAVWQSA